MSTITILIVLLYTAVFCMFIMLTDVYQKWVLDREIEKIRKRVLKEAYSRLRSK